jgi:type-F conjugative transfer system pilin assembly protein TrbC
MSLKTVMGAALALSLVFSAIPDDVSCAPAKEKKEKRVSPRRGRAKPKADVIVPKIEILNEYELPENFDNPEGLQQYMEEIRSENLIPANQESPLAARHLLPVEQPDHSADIDRWTQDVSDLLMERGGINVEGRKRVQEYINMNREKSPYADLNMVVFISSSVPDATIRHLVDQLGDSPNVVFAVRGFVGNDASKIMPTMSWLKNHRCRQAGRDTVCATAPMDVNPLLFSKMKIDQVPALAYIPDPQELENCADDEALNDDDYLVFYGDVSPEYVMERFLAARPEDMKLQLIAEAIKPVAWERKAPPAEEAQSSGAPENIPEPEPAAVPRHEDSGEQEQSQSVDDSSD